MSTDTDRLTALAYRALAAEPDVVPDSIMFEWGDYYGQWKRALTVHYDVHTVTGTAHRHHYLV